MERTSIVSSERSSGPSSSSESQTPQSSGSLCDTGEFIMPDNVEIEVRASNRRLRHRVDELRDAIEKMAMWTHNRFHGDLGTNWRSCTMISCRLARQQLDKRGTTT